MIDQRWQKIEDANKYKKDKLEHISEAQRLERERYTIEDYQEHEERFGFQQKFKQADNQEIIREKARLCSGLLRVDVSKAWPALVHDRGEVTV